MFLRCQRPARRSVWGHLISLLVMLYRTKTHHKVIESPFRLQPNGGSEPSEAMGPNAVRSGTIPRMKSLPCTNYSDVELGTVLGDHGQLWGWENCSGSDLAPGVDDH